MSIVKLNNRGVRSATTFGSISALGEMRFIKKLTASSSATISFDDGTSDVVLDNSYKEYLFTFNNIHPATNGTGFQFQLSVDSGSNYNTAITSTFFRAHHNEGDTETVLGYDTGLDAAQSTSFVKLTADVGADNDQCFAGEFRLFNPSSTTFVKHFIAHTIISEGSDFLRDDYIGGYGNTTSAVDAIQFKFASGNIDAGDICLYGIN